MCEQNALCRPDRPQVPHRCRKALVLVISSETSVVCSLISVKLESLGNSVPCLERPAAASLICLCLLSQGVIMFTMSRGSRKWTSGRVAPGKLIL